MTFNECFTFVYRLTVVGFLFFFIFKGCDGEKNINNTYILKDSTVSHHYDSTVHFINTDIKEIKQGEIVYVPVPANVDTNKIFKDYFAKHPFSQEFIDTNIWASVKDTISENKILSRIFSYKLLKPQTIITNNYQTKEKPHIYLGGMVNGGKGFGIGPALSLSNNQDLLSIGYDLIGQNVSLSYNRKLGKGLSVK